MVAYLLLADDEIETISRSKPYPSFVHNSLALLLWVKIEMNAGIGPGFFQDDGSQPVSCPFHPRAGR